MFFFKNLQNRIDDILNHTSHYYIPTVIAIHVLYILALIGVLSFNSVYLRLFNGFVQLFICVFLMFRFHPFRKHELKEYDSKIIFSSAAFLLFNLGVVEFITSFGSSLLSKI
jgi:hypothetical protein